MTAPTAPKTAGRTGPGITITLSSALAEAAKPLYSAVGAYDAAFAAARKLPASYQAEAKARRDALATQVRELRGSVQAQVKELPATVKELRGIAEAQAKEIPDLAKELPTRAQARFGELRGAAEVQAKGLPELVKGLPARTQAQLADLQKQVEKTVDKVQKQATGAYAGYVARGEKVVSGYVRTSPRPTSTSTSTSTKSPSQASTGTKKASAKVSRARKTAGPTSSPADGS